MLPFTSLNDLRSRPHSYTRLLAGTPELLGRSFFAHALGSAGERAPTAVQAFEERIELLKLGFDYVRLCDGLSHRFEGFVTVTGYRYYHALIGINPPLRDELHCDRQRGAAGRFGKHPLGARQQFYRVNYFRVGGDFAPSTGLAYGAQHVETVGRVADCDRLGDCVGLDRSDQV